MKSTMMANDLPALMITFQIAKHVSLVSKIETIPQGDMKSIKEAAIDSFRHCKPSKNTFFKR